MNNDDERGALYEAHIAHWQPYYDEQNYQIGKHLSAAMALHKELEKTNKILIREYKNKMKLQEEQLKSAKGGIKVAAKHYFQEQKIPIGKTKINYEYF